MANDHEVIARELQAELEKTRNDTRRPVAETCAVIERTHRLIEEARVLIKMSKRSCLDRAAQTRPYPLDKLGELAVGSRARPFGRFLDAVPNSFGVVALERIPQVVFLRSYRAACQALHR